MIAGEPWNLQRIPLCVAPPELAEPRFGGAFDVFRIHGDVLEYPVQLVEKETEEHKVTTLNLRIL